MLNSFFLSFKLKNTYLVNSIIYSLKHTILIKKVLPYSLYDNKGLKIFASIVSFIIDFISIFLGKFIYVFLCFLLPSSFFLHSQLMVINAIVFLTIIGSMLNTNIFNPSVDKYYAIILMKFDAKKYVLSQYIYFLLSIIVGFIPGLILIKMEFNLSVITCILIPLFIVSVKNITNAWVVYSSKKNNKVYNENKALLKSIIYAAILLVLAYGLPYLNIGINELLFDVIVVVIIILGMITFYYLYNSNYFNKLCKDLLKNDEMINYQSTDNHKVFQSQITNDISVISNKKGYAYFNDIFVQRHRRLLTNATKNISIGLIIIFIICSILCIIFKDKNKEVNDLLKNYLCYFMFIMYFINRGQKICQTMFINCDHSMLTYRFYKQPKAILGLFKERLLTLIRLNIIPGVIIAVGTIILLIITGGASSLEYIITFLSIISMSIFFSVHYLVLYYLLQPYDLNLTIKNPTFSAVCSFTYVICYMFSQVHITTIIFGFCMCIFTVIYTFISLYFVYHYATKTFKLRL